MTDRNQEQQSETRPQQAETPNVPTPKKTFVEPTISSPVDVLEATTFFQSLDSGDTGIRRRSTD